MNQPLSEYTLSDLLVATGRKISKMHRQPTAGGMRTFATLDGESHPRLLSNIRVILKNQLRNRK